MFGRFIGFVFVAALSVVASAEQPSVWKQAWTEAVKTPKLLVVVVGGEESRKAIERAIFDPLKKEFAGQPILWMAIDRNSEVGKYTLLASDNAQSTIVNIYYPASYEASWDRTTVYGTALLNATKVRVRLQSVLDEIAVEKEKREKGTSPRRGMPPEAPCATSDQFK